MRRLIKFLFSLTFISALIGIPVYYFFFLPVETPTEELFEVEIPQQREIKQIITATGTLKIKDQVDIGSMVSGKIKMIFVKENDNVREGQLLAEVDPGTGDTEVRVAEADYEKALAELEYNEADYRRKELLYADHYISDADFQEARRNYKTSMAEVKSLKAALDKQLISLENNKIYAPSAGIIIDVLALKGEKVSSDVDGGTILTLGPDTRHIEAELEICEKDIGQIQNGQKVSLKVDTYPNRVFESTIQTIGFAGKDRSDSGCVYLAKVLVDNPRLLLRPGMSVNATIDVAKQDSALTVTARSFLIKKEHLESISDLMQMPIDSIEDHDKEELVEAHPESHIQFLWVACEDCFREVPVEIGITDNVYFEILSGLQGDEELVVDVLEDDKMREFYEKHFRKL